MESTIIVLHEITGSWRQFLYYKTTPMFCDSYQGCMVQDFMIILKSDQNQADSLEDIKKTFFFKKKNTC